MEWNLKTVGYGATAAILVAMVAAVVWAVFKAVLDLASVLMSTTVVSAILITVTWTLQMLVTVIMGILLLAAVAVATLAIAWLVILVYAAAFKRCTSWVRRATEQSKEAAIDSVSLAVLAGLIGVVAWLTTSDFTKPGEMSLAKAIALASMIITLLKMGLYIDNSNVRRAVWPLLAIFYAAPFAYGTYIWHEKPCTADKILTCLFELDPAHLRDPVTVVGYVLIVCFAVFAMTFPYRLMTWKRFVGMAQ